MANTKYKEVLIAMTIDNDHRRRHSLTIPAYLLIKMYLHALHNDYKFGRPNAMKMFGIEDYFFMQGFNDLREMGFADYYKKENGKTGIKIFDSILTHFNASFEEFWAPIGDLKWGASSKSDSEVLFNRIAKKHGEVYLVNRKKAYFEYLLAEQTHNKFDRRPMGAKVFLNVREKKYDIKWEEETAAILKKHKIVKPVVDPDGPDYSKMTHAEIFSKEANQDG